MGPVNPGATSRLSQGHLDVNQSKKFYVYVQRTPWGGGKKRGEENLTNDTPSKKGLWTPVVRYVFHPPQVSVLCFSYTKIHDRAEQKLFWRDPKNFRESAFSGTFSSPHTFCTPPYHGPCLCAFFLPEHHLPTAPFQHPKIHCVVLALLQPPKPRRIKIRQK